MAHMVDYGSLALAKANKTLIEKALSRKNMVGRNFHHILFMGNQSILFSFI